MPPQHKGSQGGQPTGDDPAHRGAHTTVAAADCSPLFHHTPHVIVIHLQAFHIVSTTLSICHIHESKHMATVSAAQNCPLQPTALTMKKGCMKLQNPSSAGA